MKSLLLSLFVLAVVPVVMAAAPGQYYHQGATNFVYGDLARAKTVVAEGLGLFPNDVKLRGLHEFLNQQPPPQSKQDQKDQQEQEKKDEKQEQSKGEDKQQDQQSDQEKEKKQEQPEPSQDQQQPSNDREKKDGEQSKAEQGKEDPEQRSPDGAAARRLMPMTLEQAQRLLEAAKSDEKVMMFTPQTRTNRNNRRLKDW